jgi:hypothetical protein
MREGVRKDGRKLDPMMPTEAFGKFDAIEIEALYKFLMSVPGRQLGGR